MAPDLTTPNERLSEPIPLTKLRTGQKARILGMSDQSDTGRRLTDLGLHPEHELRILSRSPMRGPIMVENLTSGVQVALARSIAERVEVERELGETPRLALLGQPNSGKSTLFNHVAGVQAGTSNFPGTTVSYFETTVKHAQHTFYLADLPGTYTLNPRDPAEFATLEFLAEHPVDLFIQVVDASLLSRSLEFTLEVLELGKPTILVCNMMDEAGRKGLDINLDQLSRELGIPVVATVARSGKGIDEVFETAHQMLHKVQAPPPRAYPTNLEDRLYQMMRLVEDVPWAHSLGIRFVAARALERSEPMLRRLEAHNPGIRSKIEEIGSGICEHCGRPVQEALQAERHHAAMKLFEQVATVKHGAQTYWGERLDRYVMHPVLGVPILLGVFVAFFTVIFLVGGTIEEAVLGPLESFETWWLTLTESMPLISRLGDGVIQGVIGGAVVVLPYFIPLVFMMSLLDDLGYLARVAVIMDALMHRIGLHGKSVVPFILGYGCNVPAITATRIIETPRDRLLSAMLVPFIPCSARTALILAIVAAYLGPLWALGLYFFNMLIVAVLGKILSRKMKGETPGLVLEIPSYKAPSLKIVLSKTWLHLRHFVRFAWPILLAGSVVLSLLELVGLTRIVNGALSPLTVGLLGLSPLVGALLVFGLLRKEMALVLIVTAFGTAHFDTVMTPLQMLTFTTLIVFFVPCLSTLALLKKDFGWKVAGVSAALHTVVAISLASLVRFGVGPLMS